eukprot:g75066.t1
MWASCDHLTINNNIEATGVTSENRVEKRNWLSKLSEASYDDELSSRSSQRLPYDDELRTSHRMTRLFYNTLIIIKSVATILTHFEP